MLHSATELFGFSLHTRDGVIGTVDDLLFDDEEWWVRYLVIDISEMLLNRKVLIAPVAIKWINAAEKHVRVSLSKEKIYSSPEVNTQLPVSRQYEVALRRYYEWPVYWGQVSFLDSPQVKGLGEPQIQDEDAGNPELNEAVIPGVTDEESLEPDQTLKLMPGESDEEEVREMEFAGPEEDTGDTSSSSHLRSARSMRDYRVNAEEQPMGFLDDFFVDNEEWSLRFMSITPQNRQGGRSLVPIQMIEKVSWLRSELDVNSPKEIIRKAPRYDVGAPLSADLEKRVYAYYDRLE
jgi:hypothetical protein